MFLSQVIDFKSGQKQKITPFEAKIIFLDLRMSIRGPAGEKLLKSYLSILKV